MKFQDTLRAKRVLLCNNPKCETNLLSSKKWRKKTLLPIKCLTRSNTKQESEKLLYYICSECSVCNCESFGKPVINQPLNLQTYFIPNHLQEDFEKMINSRGSQKCLFCNLKEIIDSDEEYVKKDEIKQLENQLKVDHSHDIKEDFENRLEELKSTSMPIYKIKECVYKLFIIGKPKRRSYVGFLCLNCQAIFYDHRFNLVKWPKSEINKINPLKPWIEMYQKKQVNLEEYKILSKQQTNPNNMVRKQELETWYDLEIEVPSKPSSLDIVYLAPIYAGGMPSERRMDRVTITLENLTIRKAIRVIEQFGSEKQKEEFRRLFYYDFNS